MTEMGEEVCAFGTKQNDVIWRGEGVLLESKGEEGKWTGAWVVWNLTVKEGTGRGSGRLDPISPSW